MKREFAKADAIVAAAPAPDAVAVAPGSTTEVAAAAAAAASLPWRLLHPHQRAGVDWLAARHLSGLGSIVADRVGAGKRLTILSHLLHLRESLGLKGPHLLVCPPEAMATWTAEIFRWCPTLRAVTLTSAAEERSPAKATTLRNGTFDIIIVPVEMIIEAGAAAPRPQRGRLRRRQRLVKRPLVAPGTTGTEAKAVARLSWRRGCLPQQPGTAAALRR